MRKVSTLCRMLQGVGFLDTASTYITSTNLAGTKADARKRVCVYIGSFREYDTKTLGGSYGAMASIDGKTRKLADIGQYVGHTVEQGVSKSSAQTSFGSRRTSGYFLTNGENASTLAVVNKADMITDTFIMPISYTGLRGFYYSNPTTLATATSDFSRIPEIRLIDKIIVITNGRLQSRIEEEIPVVSGGRPTPTWRLTLQGQILGDLVANTASFPLAEASELGVDVPSESKYT